MNAAVVLVTAAFFLAAAANVSAQGPRRDPPRNGSWELGGGVVWSAGFPGGNRAAELTRNGETAGGFDLFTSNSRMAGTPGVATTLGYYVSTAVALEAGFRFSKPQLRVRLSGDFEDAQELSASETLARYVFTGSVVWHLRGMTFGRNGVPFVAAGAGHIRDLHEGEQLIETGTEYHLLGGIKYWIGSGRRRFSVRGQAGISVGDGGFDFKDEPRMLPIASASLMYLF